MLTGRTERTPTPPAANGTTANGIALTTGTVDSPMRRVRLDTADEHILLSDAATRNDRLSGLDQAAQVARQYGLSHQLRSIEGIRKDQQR